MKFRKKPIVIEAEQFDAECQPYPAGVCTKPCLDGGWISPHVHTIHNNQAVRLSDRDWIIPEPDGVHFYPCKDEIFRDTYEAGTGTGGKDMLNKLVSMIGNQHCDCEVFSGLVVSKFKSTPGFRATMFNAGTGNWTIGDFRPEQTPDFVKWIEKMI